MTTIKCYICHHESLESLMYAQEIIKRFPFMIPYKLNSTKLFESEFFKNVEIDENCKYIGMITYRVTERAHVLMTNIAYILTYSETDVVTVNYSPLGTQPLSEAEFFHPGFKNIWIKLMKKLLPYLSEEEAWSDKIPMFYNNYWYARPKVLLEYREFLKKAEEELEKIPEVYDNSNYLTGNSTKEQLKKITGKPYYTFHPFIYERLPCIFVWYKGYTCLHTTTIVKEVKRNNLI